MSEDRFDRSIRFFGHDGQQKIAETRLAIVGVSGLGSFLVQHAALLGFGAITLIDPGKLKVSGRNRNVAARFNDATGMLKVELGRRLIAAIDPTIQVETLADSVISESGVQAIKDTDVVLGGVDLEGIRLLLLQLCGALQKPYIDTATEVISDAGALRYGGRVCCSYFGDGCLACLDILDRVEANKDLEGESERANRRSVYGVKSDFLMDSGPSVSPLNGVVASLAMMELMAHVTGLRQPHSHLNYDGRTGKVMLRAGRITNDCYFCDGVFRGEVRLDPLQMIRMSPTTKSPDV